MSAQNHSGRVSKQQRAGVWPASDGRINLVRGVSDRPSPLSNRSSHLLGLCCWSRREGTGQTQMVGGMGGPDTSGIDLDPGRFRCRADLVVCLQQLHNDIGCPSYRDLEETGKNMGIKLPLAWKTMELFLRVCNVPGTELDRWRAAWKAAMAPDKPTWQEENQHLRAQIDQLTAALTAAKSQIDQLAADARKAEARVVDCEKALADWDQTQSAKPFLPEHDLEVLRLKAAARRGAGDYEGSQQLYEQIAYQLKYKHRLGPGDRRTLRVKSLQLDAMTCRFFCLMSPDEYVPSGPKPSLLRERLAEDWEYLVREHQRWLPEGDPMTFRVRLRQAYWADTMWSHGLARRILNDLHVDCKVFLSSDDPLTTEVVQRMKNGFPAKTQKAQQPDNIFFFDNF
jgi:hypothetical protein